MSALTFTKIPDCEALIANDLREWFEKEIDFSELFPREKLKVSTDHPFVALLQQNVPEGEKYNVSGFPCVTVIDTSFSKLVETQVAPEVMKILPAIITEIENGGRNKFIMSKQDLASLKELFKTNEFVRAEGFQTLRKTSLAIEIWSTNSVQKGKIFDLVSMYLVGQQRFNQYTQNEIIIEEETISGERSGIYNFDFGEVLYGGMIRFNVAYTVGQYTVKDYEIGASVQVQVNGMVGGDDE